jgi:predicted nucleic acid-binding protein
MTLLVVDASVGLKWFLPEVYSAAASRLREPAFQLHVPGLFDVEIGNILWKKMRRAELTRAEADAILDRLPRLPVTRHADAPLVPAALDLAEKTQRTVYDCLYLALAVQLGGRLVTADARLSHGLADTPWGNSLLWIENVP